MEQELVKELNKKIIEQFVDTYNDIVNKIKVFEEMVNTESLGEEVLNNIKMILSNLKEVEKKLKNEITSMKKKDEKGISLFVSADKRIKTITSGTDYDVKFMNKVEKDKNVEEEINNYNRLIGELGDGKIASSVKGSLNKRIESLRKKQGKIKNQQSKILDKAINKKLKNYLSGINNRQINSIVSSEKKKADNLEKITKLNSEKDMIKSNREVLLADKNLLVKGLGVKMLFNEKLTANRIAGLKAKNGVLNFKDKQIVKRGVHPSIIKRMKDNVKKFVNALGDSFKAGVDNFKSYYQEEPTIVRTR